MRRIGTVGSAVAVHWHSRLNQIFVGTGQNTFPQANHVAPVSCMQVLSGLLVSAGVCEVLMGFFEAMVGQSMWFCTLARLASVMLASVIVQAQSGRL